MRGLELPDFDNLIYKKGTSSPRWLSARTSDTHMFLEEIFIVGNFQVIYFR